MRVDMAPGFATPLMNSLFGALPPADRLAIERCCEIHMAPPGTVVVEAGCVVQHLIFPLDTVLSIEQAGGLELSLVGREGLFGWSAVASFQISPFRAVVRCRAGSFLKLPLADFVLAHAGSPALRQLMCEYLIATTMQLSETIAAYSSHVDARLARWLLARHDRLRGDEIRTQHDEVARNLGVRRASITDCLHVLEGRSILRCRRGRIIIRDRAALEAIAGSCYGGAEARFRALYGAFGRSDPAARREPVAECDFAALPAERRSARG